MVEAIYFTPCVWSSDQDVAFQNAHELIYLWALKFSLLSKLYIFQYIGKIFYVEFQNVPLKFHTKYLNHTLKVHLSIYRKDILCGISKSTFKIPYKIFKPYTESGDSYTMLKIEELSYSRAHMHFLNVPKYSKIMSEMVIWLMSTKMSDAEWLILR